MNSTAEESPAIASSLADAVAQVLASDNESNAAENVPAKQDAATNEDGEIRQQPPLAGAAAEAEVRASLPNPFSCCCYCHLKIFVVIVANASFFSIRCKVVR